MTSTDYTINPTIKRKLYGIAGALFTLAIPFVLMLQNVNHHLDNDQSFCPFKMLTGFPCPGCGITKSLVYFYEGDIGKSLSYHILGPAVVGCCVFAILLLSTEIYTGKDYFNRWLFNKNLAYTLGVLLASYHIIRLMHFVQQNSWSSILHQSIWQ